MAKNFKELSEREILALAVSLEEEDGHIYGDFVDGCAKPIRPPRKCSRRCRPRKTATAAP
jgi:hypothetical protein